MRLYIASSARINPAGSSTFLHLAGVAGCHRARSLNLS